MNELYSYIHPNALVEKGVVIGEGSHIGPFCIIREGAKIGKSCRMTAYCEVRENVIIGDNVSMGSRCTISANAKIGSNVLIKYGFVLTDTKDLTEDKIKSVGSIGDGTLIGANVTLMPNISIGKESIIGACSQVRTNVGDKEIWYGNPAKFFRKVKSFTTKYDEKSGYPYRSYA